MLNGKFGNMIKLLENTYKGKRVFVTGHTGFKGTWLIKILSILGADIKGFALVPEQTENLYSLIKGDTLCHSIIADIRDKNVLNSEILNFQPDFIFHLAAQPLVRLSYEMPQETFEINALGTANVLEAIRLIEKKSSSVFITTDKVYYNNEWEYPYREQDRLGGYDPYSASKACAELVIDSYRNSFFSIREYSNHQKAIAVARAGNVIGGGDWAKDRLLPDIIKALSKNEKIFIRNPKAVRPWQHVMEPLIGYLLLGAKLNSNPAFFSQPFNLGPYLTDAISVEEMVQQVIEYWGSGNYEINLETKPPHEASLLKLDISKALTYLDWVPRFNASQSVARTVAWYKSYYEGGDADYLLQNDINFYLNF